MGKIFKKINIGKIFTPISPYNSSYTKIGTLIETGNLDKLEEISKASSSHKTNLKIRSTKEAA